MKRKLNLQIEELAHNEINDAYEWYEEQSPGLGKIFLKALDLAFNNIQKSPNGYQKIETQAISTNRFPFCCSL